MTVGEIFWVDLPARGGHTQAGRRPAIVAQSGAVSDALPTVILIPLTTQLDALRFPGTVLVQPDAENRLRQPSVALVFQLAAIDQRFLAARSGRVSPPVLRQLWNALDRLTGRQPA
jgi:mRNA-degrading endonuclease toxin of MazEF toxin-antitoxin module